MGIRKIAVSACALMMSVVSGYAEAIQTEYFFDEDPGYGRGFKAGVTTNGTISFKADIRGLKYGFHTLYVRGKNYDGWGQCVAIPVTIFGRTSDIKGTEYYLDKDPGEGKGTFVQSAAGEASTFSAVLNMDLKDVKTGFHTLYSRALANSGEWSSVISTPFVYLPIVGEAVKAEFYIDKDPGEGNGKVVNMNDSKVSFTVSTDNLKDGQHTLYVRSQDSKGSWTMDYGVPFTFDSRSGETKWNNDMEVSPNPAMFNFDLKVTSNPKDDALTTVSIITRSGMALFEETREAKAFNVNINVKEYAPGAYQVVAVKSGEIQIRKLVIKR